MRETGRRKREKKRRDENLCEGVGGAEKQNTG